MSNLDNLMDSLHEFEKKLLNVLNIPLSIDKAIELTKLSKMQILKGAQWLSNKELIVIKEKKEKLIGLTQRGKETVKKGLPETRLLEAVKNSNKKINEITNLDKNEFNKALGECKKQGLISILKGEIQITKLGKEYLKNETKKQKTLEKLQEQKIILKKLKIKEEELNELITRGLIEITEETDWEFITSPLGVKLLKKGIDLDKELLERNSTQLIKSHDWEKKDFRRYNINEKVPKKYFGKKHPYQEFINQTKQLFVSMGFKEMPGKYVENNFTNCDALFMPQDHPARGIHDIFYIKSPEKASLKEYKKFIKNVKKAHEKGIKGSTGWKVEFDEEFSKKHVLRSQTTSASIRKLMSPDLEIPGKYFIIERNVRPDVIDRTHGAEFLQMEGIVLAENINFSSLLALLRMFAEKIAKVDKYLIMPDYYPYTEPSASLHIYKNGRWMELGGAGMFRKEVTEPAGVKVPVIAWGLGFDRTFMSSYNIKDIREIFTSNLDWLRNVEVNK